MFDISEDLTSFAFIDRKDNVEFLDLDGEILASLEGHTDWINSIDTGLDGETIVTGSDDRTVRVWNNDGTLLETLIGHEAGVNSVSLSPDNHRIVSGSDDKTVRIWSTTGEFIKEIDTHAEEVIGVTFNPNGKLIVSASRNNNVHFWDSKTYLENGTLFSLGNISSIDSISFNKEGNILALGHGMDSLNLHFLGHRGIWFKNARLTPINSFFDLELNGDRPLETIAVDDGLEIVALGLDALMEKACNRVRGYLKNSSRVDPKDRKLCDGIGDEEVE